MTSTDTRGIYTTIAVLALTAGIGTATQAGAAPITPQFDTFGELAVTEFGGDGIPNDAVAITTITDGNSTITLGLTATERFTSPPVGNDGAGTFFAGPGESDPGLALWNFDFYAGIEGGGTLNDYNFLLFYDFDPGVNTGASAHGILDFDAVISDQSGTLIEGSQNLGFGYLANDSLSYINAPDASSFDPNAIGEYTFAFRAFTAGPAPTLAVVDPFLGQSAIRVNVGDVTAVPEPSSLAILGMALVGLLAGAGIRRRNATTV